MPCLNWPSLFRVVISISHCLSVAKARRNTKLQSQTFCRRCRRLSKLRRMSLPPMMRGLCNSSNSSTGYRNNKNNSNNGRCWMSEIGKADILLRGISRTCTAASHRGSHFLKVCLKRMIRKSLNYYFSDIIPLG